MFTFRCFLTKAHGVRMNKDVLKMMNCMLKSMKPTAECDLYVLPFYKQGPLHKTQCSIVMLAVQNSPRLPLIQDLVRNRPQKKPFFFVFQIQILVVKALLTSGDCTFFHFTRPCRNRKIISLSAEVILSTKRGAHFGFQMCRVYFNYKARKALRLLHSVSSTKQEECLNGG